ncbi:uncharacterized protein LOC126161177 [Schistocerca cancellata]|uniref:uncharacterized protein LOC126161177 n=1 Tax=Schistocerca cancellata TaxID=274614 RepID=UPI002117629B|nr:uncharacterized protein LOC126161177 [Schistocerca cancellata]
MKLTSCTRTRQKKLEAKKSKLKPAKVISIMTTQNGDHCKTQILEAGRKDENCCWQENEDEEDEEHEETRERVPLMLENPAKGGLTFNEMQETEVPVCSKTKSEHSHLAIKTGASIGKLSAITQIKLEQYMDQEAESLHIQDLEKEGAQTNEHIRDIQQEEGSSVQHLKKEHINEHRDEDSGDKAEESGEKAKEFGKEDEEDKESETKAVVEDKVENGCATSKLPNNEDSEKVWQENYSGSSGGMETAVAVYLFIYLFICYLSRGSNQYNGLYN